MRRIKNISLLIALFLWGLNLYAQEPILLEKIVVTPYRIEDSQSHQVDVLEQEYLEKKDKFSLADSFNFINGLDIVGGGRYGSNSLGMFIRGAQPRHTSFMLEGIKVYDPANPSGYYLPIDLSLVGLEQIEIVKGPLSALYGSSSVGGAINLLLKKPPEAGYFYLESKGGWPSLSQEIVEAGGRFKNLSYLFGFSRLDAQGLWRAKKKDNPERDPYQNTNLLLHLNYNCDEDWELGLFSKASHSRLEIDDDDNWDGLVEDDLDNFSWNNELVNSFYLKQRLNPFLAYKVQFGHTSIFRRTQDEGEEYVRDWYKGQTYQALTQLEINPFNFYKAVCGFDYTQEIVQSYANYSGWTSSMKETNNLKGFFWENIFTPLEGLKISNAYRREVNPLFKYHSAKRVELSYKIPYINNTLYFSYSEDFKAPSIYQLYSSSGNPNLRPETSKMWEWGCTQTLEDLELSFSYFHTDFRNLIDFVYLDPSVYLGRYENAAKAKSRGLEVKLLYRFGPSLRLKAGYTYLEGKQDFVDADMQGGVLVSTDILRQSLIRIPKNKAFFELEGKLEKLEFNFGLSYFGKRRDRIFIFDSVNFDSFDEFVEMKPYLEGSIYVGYNLFKEAFIFLEVHNLWDKDYERIKGFQEQARSFYGGFRLRF